MKPERIQLDSDSPTPAPRLVRYEGGLGEVLTVDLRQPGRIARFDLDEERVRELPAGDAADLFGQRRYFVELTADDEAFARRFGLDAVPEDVERDDDGRIVHSLRTGAVVIAAKNKRRRAKKAPAKKTTKKSDKTTGEKN